MKTKLIAILDFEKINLLLEGFNKVTGFVTAILDLDGNVLSKSGWRTICTDFHRVNSETAAKCTESDTCLARQLKKGEKYHFYKCLNGLVDVAVPIIINNEHVANLFSGQFFFEQPDRSFFKKQAEKYKFDHKTYLEALDKVPVVSEEKVKTAMEFLLNMTNMISEITQQKLEQTELNKSIREREEKFKSVFESANVGKSITLPTGEMNVNEAFCKMLGYTREELQNKKWQNITPEEEIATIQKMLTPLRIGEKDSAKFEKRYICKDGTHIWADVSISIQHDDKGKPLYFITTIIDITEHKLAEQAIYESEMRFRLMFERNNAIMLEVDADSTRIVNANPAAQDFYGYPIETLKQMYIKDINAQSPKEIEVVRQQIVQEKLNSFVVPHRLASGELRTVELHSSPVVENGKTTLFTIVHDITERKKAEDKIRSVKENLKNTFDISPSIICKADLNAGCFIDASQAVTRILGYSVEEFTSKPFVDLIHPDDRQRTADEVLEQMNGNNTIFFENRYLCKDGSYKWMAWDSTKADKNGIVTAIAADITERKHAELKLNQSTQLLEASQSIAKLGGWELDISTNNLFWTAETYRIHDTSPKEFNPTVDAGVGYFLPESRRVISNALEIAIKDGEGYDLELETLTTKGRRIDIRTTCEVTLHEGQPTKLAGIFQDITEKKQAEKELKESEKRFKTLHNASFGGIAIHNKGLILDCNQGLSDITGYSADELMGKDGLLLIAEDSRKVVKQNILASYEKSYEVVGLRKNGKEFPLRLAGKTVPYKGGDMRIIEFRDITQEKLAEKALIESDKKFKKLMEGMPLPICLADKEGNIIFRNNRFMSIFGFSEAEVPSLKEWWEKAYPDEQYRKWVIENWETKVENAAANDIDIQSDEYKVTCKDGAILDIIISGITMGESFLATFIDITERKLSETELREHKENLEILVEERTKELKDKYSELERINKLFVGRELRMIELKEKIKSIENTK